MTRSAPTIITVSLTLAAALASSVIGDPPRILLDRELSVRSAQIDGISSTTISFRDDDERRHELPLDACLALLPADAVSVSRSGDTVSGIVALTDGQRFPGRLSEAVVPADQLAWVHEWLGEMRIPVDDIAAILVSGRHSTFQGSREADVVTLINGDRLLGFVDRLGDPVRMSVGFGDQERAQEIPFSRVASIVLVTEPKPASGRRVWLREGTVFDVERFGVGDDGYLRLRTRWAGENALLQHLRLDDVVAAVFRPEAIVPLASLPPVRVEPITPRYRVPEPRQLEPLAPLGLGALDFSGPLRVHYAIPRGATRFAGEARLPRAARVWGDYELVVRLDGVEAFRARVNDEAPLHEISLVLDGAGELTIEIEPGVHGPVQDRLVLRRAVFLVGE